ncbi:alpha-mannosyltransferase [Corynebacterium yudongzhengii]|uniref:Glycosyltransferase family 1 protein n=1 Tax=Corynebacterium yudongzhengii TaxID=2080740 RepID=A0A2U1TA05_9CORY|nr:glycosyltransferase family 1 protein [Corynebacterium yudongzhengii]AWB81189.1 alpha-mannosyltransferase [Corynebacterium yudongzhengii]PWC02728.1 glycosyltransferase family 1 protein [Corynebacterium yudongzhengii]
MRVAIVAESFLPNINGVTNSVLRVLEHLQAHGHDAVVIAPGARDHQEEVRDYLGFPIVRVPTVRVPLIDSLPVGVPNTAVHETLSEFRPDIVHLASPFVLGASGAITARQLRIPAVALYQTDVAGFATKYHLAPLAAASWEWARTIHNMCQLTLAPSSLTIRELENHGIRNIVRWGRGVDTQRFHPTKRCAHLRRQWDPTGTKKIVGFVGRLAPEKGVHRLQRLANREDIQLVIVGDGPSRGELEARLPGAVFTGALGGEELAHAYASLDLFVHAGEFETFCQTIQEAQASGVPTIGPRAGGPVDLIDEGVNGLLLDVDTFAEDLPAAAAWALETGRLPQLRDNARASVANKTWDSLCEQLMSYYRHAIAADRYSRNRFGWRWSMPEWADKGLGGRVA